MPLKRPRFDLFTLIETTAAIAFVCALFAGAGTSTTWTARFTILPGDDAALRAWLVSEDFRSVTLEREDRLLTIHWEERGLKSRMMTDVEVPWQELGYSDPALLRMSYRWAPFSGSPYLWLGGIAMLLLLAQFRKHFLSAAPGGPQTPPSGA